MEESVRKYQYLLGQYYADKGESVYYDLSFYRMCGLDLTSQFARNFDLLKAFPYLPFREATKTMINVYRQEFYNVGNDTEGNPHNGDYSFLQYTSPLYLGGYYQIPPELRLGTFHSLFKMVSGVLDAPNERFYHEIEKNPFSVAVHVRRGDLKEEIYSYGKPATLAYFKQAVDFFICKIETPFFYFFSDEPDWVEQVLLPSLCLSQSNSKVVSINGSDKGYMDLFLIASCKHQITSKGTLGKYGALLLDNSKKYVILCDDETQYSWKTLLCNPIFI